MYEKFNDCVLLTTEKDYYRLQNSLTLKNLKIEYLKIKLEINDKNNLIKLIKDKI